ncbi:MAG: hypothetical protein M3Q89_14785 [Verrucomicrobiota bacterium]|nr:hypothetical protein [Verrucomicrobiota bacterium]
MIDDTPGELPPERKVSRKTPPATPAVQAWLDGEEERENLTHTGENETAELWTRINSEAAQLRRRNTPIHVQHKILSSLPDIPPPASAAKPKISGTMAILGGMVLVLVGTLIGLMLVR